MSSCALVCDHNDLIFTIEVEYDMA